MNELIRRAAYLNANGGDGSLWSGLDFTADGPSFGLQQQQQDGRQNEQVADKPTRGFDQSRDGHREMAQTGWENPSASSSTSGAGDTVFATRAMGEERERVDFNVSVAKDDSSMGMRIGVPEILEERGGRQRRRQSDGNLQDDMTSSSDQSEGYAVASHGTMTASNEQTQQMALSSVSSLGPRASTKPQSTIPDPWASLLSGQPVLDMLEQGFNAASTRPSTIEDGSSAHEGLQVYTIGHLHKGIGVRGSEDLPGWWAPEAETDVIYGDSGGSSGQEQPEGYQDSTPPFGTRPESEAGTEEEFVQPTPSNSLIRPGAPSLSSSSSSSGSQKLHVRQSTYVPGWAVPPRVLLVDDDAMSRKLSSKFLKVFGCTIDVADDGVGAVNKMNLEKYDLVLMDIVMAVSPSLTAATQDRGAFFWTELSV